MAEAAVELTPQVASQTLDAVAREVTASLAEARMALEAYVEQPDNVGLLHKSLAELAQVQGVLRVMEIHGAALLAEEMHQVCQYLAATAKEKKNQNEALDALMRAMVQLPGYLDRVLAGGRDMALVLLPLLNDMRAVRGSPLLSEGTLLSLNLKSDQQASPQVPDESRGKVSQLARKARSRYQMALIGWIRGARVELLNNLLYYVARSTSSGPRVTAVRASFRLGELLPVDDSIEQERENLSAPSVKLMQTVAVAIREDLAKVKD